MPFPRAWAQSEKYTASYKIWTPLIKFISYDNNHYTLKCFWKYDLQVTGHNYQS